MSQSELSFDQRVRKLMRKHRLMSEGVVHRIGSDGLITAYPRRRRPSFPLRAVVVLVIAAFMFKAFLYHHLGDETYNARVGLLEAGTPFEQVGAWIMQADPTTIWLAQTLGPYLPL
jgi:hypothetical protein